MVRSAPHPGKSISFLNCWDNELELVMPLLTSRYSMNQFFQRMFFIDYNIHYDGEMHGTIAANTCEKMNHTTLGD